MNDKSARTYTEIPVTKWLSPSIVADATLYLTPQENGPFKLIIADSGSPHREYDLPAGMRLVIERTES